jgi:hypothetical protein
MLHWKQLVNLSDEQLAGYDIAAANLACAAGLPGNEGIDAAACLARLDQWAEQVHDYTEAWLTHFHDDPSVYDHSERLFRIVCLVRRLKKAGLRYNPAKIPAEAVFGPADSFIYEAVFGAGGTCASLPVVYTAVGRRLGYPLKLVETRQHLFFRWDGPDGERFNVEATNAGISTHPDEYYRRWPHPLSQADEQDGLLLRSMTPRMELAGFLAERGLHWREHGDYRQAVEAFLWALELVPENACVRRRAVKTLHAWGDEVRAMTPPYLPVVNIRPPPRRYQSVPKELEREMILWETIEKILNHPDWDSRVWGTTGPIPGRSVSAINVIVKQ